MTKRINRIGTVVLLLLLPISYVFAQGAGKE